MSTSYTQLIFDNIISGDTLNIIYGKLNIFAYAKRQLQWIVSNSIHQSKKCQIWGENKGQFYKEMTIWYLKIVITP
ncbi:hypothetical protein ACH3XW_47620 [Acanthocheilonema viteae]